MKLKVLGSCSPYSTDKVCGVSYLISDGEEKVMLDCGCGSSRNMNIPKDLNNLTIIISHYHRDHYMELLAYSYASYISNSRGVLDSKIKVYLPKEECLSKTYIESFKESSNFEYYYYDENTVLQINSMEISFTKSYHSVLTYSIKVKSKGRVIVYSSDSGYANENIVPFSKDADLLICESTFLKNQSTNSPIHLNTIEAASIAKKANVKLLMLNHFWPNIDKNEYVLEAKEVFPNVIAAVEKEEFDFD